MELNFTGRGAMLNPNEGNNAAYFEDNNNFFLIDCGEDVAGKLIRMGKLDQDKNYYVFITHTHGDHIGSIGTLQQYLYWVRGKKLKIVFGNGMRYANDILAIMNSFGIVQGTYDIVNTRMLNDISPMFSRIRYVESTHGDTPLKSASIIIETDNGNILYTGDIADSRVIREFLTNNFPDTIDKIYVDTSLEKNSVHLSLEELRRVIPIGLSEKVYCMHLSSKELIPEIYRWGFNVVQSDKSNLMHRDIDFLSEEELKAYEEVLKGELDKIQDIKNNGYRNLTKKF